MCAPSNFCARAPTLFFARTSPQQAMCAHPSYFFVRTHSSYLCACACIIFYAQIYTCFFGRAHIHECFWTHIYDFLRSNIAMCVFLWQYSWFYCWQNFNICMRIVHLCLKFWAQILFWMKCKHSQLDSGFEPLKSLTWFRILVDLRRGFGVTPRDRCCGLRSRFDLRSNGIGVNTLPLTEPTFWMALELTIGFGDVGGRDFLPTPLRFLSIGFEGRFGWGFGGTIRRLVSELTADFGDVGGRDSLPTTLRFLGFALEGRFGVGFGAIWGLVFCCVRLRGCGEGFGAEGFRFFRGGSSCLLAGRFFRTCGSSKVTISNLLFGQYEEESRHFSNIWWAIGDPS